MLRLLNINIFSLCCLLFLSTLISAQDVQCDPANRPTLESCANEPNENTCGFFEANCPVDICIKKTNSACEACSDPSVVYYRKEECDPAHVFETCYADICSPDNRIWPGPFYDPVCGFKRDDNEQPIQQTFENVCKLCQESDFVYFQRGPCPNDRTYCDPNSPPNSDANPVCASFQAEDSNTAYVTVASAAEACLDTAVEFWTQGPCGKMAKDATYCLPNKRTSLCSRDFTPVCGFYYEDGVMKHKVMDNDCAACEDPNIIYHTIGLCYFTCFPDPPYVPRGHAGEIFPICGTYLGENGEELTVSLTNPGIGCHPSGVPILSYQEGLCPGDKGIRCEDDAGGYLGFDPHVVCGYSTEDCEDDSCRKTYALPATACRNGQNVGYFPGPCPGDVGIPCEEDLRGILNIVAGNVCGYWTPGCTDPTCRKDYESYLSACIFSNMIYVVPGQCNTIS